MENCGKPPNGNCPKEKAEQMGGKIKQKIKGDEEVHPCCALCRWYTGHINNKEIRELRAKLFILSELKYDL